MNPALRRVLLGRARTDLDATRWAAIAAGLFLTTFAAYAIGIFEIQGGIVWIPGDAALVGLLAACVAGYVRGGLIAAWLVAYASLLGYRADHAFLGLYHRSLPYRFGYFVDPEGLFVYALEGVVVGSIAFAAGTIARRGVDALRGRAVHDRAG